MIKGMGIKKSIKISGSANHLTVEGLRKIGKSPVMQKFVTDCSFKTAACRKMRHGQCWSLRCACKCHERGL
jgi:hypothetical protein